MPKLLILDTETTSLETDTQVCEVAATLYNVDADVRKCGAIASVSFLIPVSVNGITPELTDIPDTYLQRDSIQYLNTLIDNTDFIVAFNVDFDKDIFTNWFEDAALLNLGFEWGHKPWLCAMSDFDWGFTNKSKYGNYSLINLALHFGIGISTAHRAGDDVRLLVEVFNRNKPNLTQLLQKAIFRANSPLVTVVANVSKPNKDLAKNQGFWWNTIIPNAWAKQVKECDLVEYSFSTSVMY